MKNNLTSQYYEWLVALTGDRRNKFVKLYQILFDTPFRWFLPNDDNRYEDGRNLKDKFINEYNIDEESISDSFFEGECSVLEMLIALAIRMNDLTFDLENQEDLTATWFYTLLKNLGLARFTDDSDLSYFNKFPPEILSTINLILDAFMDRRYDVNGNGSLFPLKTNSRYIDMTQTEIWYQMMEYLGEKDGL